MVKDVIEKRRAYRMISDLKIEKGMIKLLVNAARLAPSCFNNQPWHYIIVTSEEALEKVKEALPDTNDWATPSPLIFAVAAKPKDSCQIGDRDYYLFDCGLSVSQLVLQATSLGLVAHPIAGYNQRKVKEALAIPEEYILITLVICGHRGKDDSLLSEKQLDIEDERPVTSATISVPKRWMI